MPLLLPKIKKNKHILKRKFLITPILIATLVFANTVIGISSNFIASAANFSMKTGYYMGTGSTKTISGIGFKPDMIIITPDSGGEGVHRDGRRHRTHRDGRPRGRRVRHGGDVDPVQPRHRPRARRDRRG